MRQVHLDFHNSPLVPDVGSDWDPEAFAATLERAGVASVTLFGKCHHGMSYYPTEAGTVHPALSFDLLGAQIDACHSRGIRTPVYLSVGWDEWLADKQPAWRQTNADGAPIGPPPDTAGWRPMCLNNGYFDVLLAQTSELLSRYECHGFWYDIVHYDEHGCLCAACRSDMDAAGIDATDVVARHGHNESIARRFMQTASELIRTTAPMPVFFNGRLGLRNTRFGLRLHEEQSSYTHLEVEALPTGGWGWDYFPLWARYARTSGLPIMGMTGRFRGHWGDWAGLKEPAALVYEAGTIFAAGGFAISVGDQLDSRGRLNEEVYRVIGEAFAHVQQVETVCGVTRGKAEIAILALEDPAGAGASPSEVERLEGASRLLLELHHQYDVISAEAGEFDDYKVIIVPDAGAPTDDLIARLRAFISSGGSLLVSHHALLDAAIEAFPLQDKLGVVYKGHAQTNPDYFAVLPGLEGPLSRSGFPYSFYEGPSVTVEAAPAAEVLAEGFNSYFDRSPEHFSSHGMTAPNLAGERYPAVVAHGSCVYINGPIFGAYTRQGTLAYRGVVAGCLSRLLPEPLVTTSAPATVEVSVLESGATTLVHLVNYQPERRSRGHIEALTAPVPVSDIRVRLRDGGNVRTATLLPQGTPVQLEHDGPAVTAVIPTLAVHAVLVLES